MELDREVIRCQVCGLVQYRTRTGNCRRCVRLLPPMVTFVIPTPSPQDLPGDDRQLFENWPNRETVENIGQRIRQLRESRGMTQSQLQARSRVSRSYLSRIESGQMTPSLGTLEKIAEALGVGLNRFFVPETNGETVLEDPFIQGLRPFLRQLDWAQWQGILKRLQAISEHVNTNHNVRPMAAPTQHVERIPHRNASKAADGSNGCVDASLNCGRKAQLGSERRLSDVLMPGFEKTNPGTRSGGCWVTARP